MITREQVADLRPGDVVELRHREWPDGKRVRGSLCARPIGLCCVGLAVRWADGEPMEGLGSVWFVELIARPPYPLYVNHSRTAPVPGDVVRDEDSDDVMALAIYVRGTDDDYWARPSGRLRSAVGPPFGDTIRYGRLRLLVDGETGQVVP